jgi:rhodanese-related sulfurtransferase
VHGAGQLGDGLPAVSLELSEEGPIDSVGDEWGSHGHAPILACDQRSKPTNTVDRLFNRPGSLRSVEGMTMTDSTSAAARHFAAKLEFETDPSDVMADREAGRPFVLIDSRGEAAWRQGRAAGAVHLPTAQIAERGREVVPRGTPVVVYCWGPGCNGSTRAALAFSLLGYQVREMIGGFEYWAREGLPIEDDHGSVVRAADPLTAPVDGASCAC